MPENSDFLDTVQSGDHEESLKVVRDLLAERLLEATIRDSAAVAKQLVAVLIELEQLGIDEEESFVDRLHRDRDNRRSGTD